ncbi:hypothetical protein FACS1894162_1410 [Bacteroidia bacterium]|nr:hypothetical protein FACS1894162_1410 [Bacteroidia bacterium]
MKKETTTTGVAAHNSEYKDTKRLADYKKVFEYFSIKPATMFQCECATGIPRSYVCWYVRDLRKNNNIQIFKLGRCPISKWDSVQFLTTDRNLFKSEVKQPSLFDEL